MNRSNSGFSLFMLLFASIAFGQMQLSYIYSRAVRDGYSVQTSVDSLLVDMQVNSGLAISKYTLVLTPGSYGYSTVDDAKRQLDSIEMTMSFQLPSDFVADSMWLWVNGEPVKAEIQDRALASQQYQQIVGQRRDPAILETWGRGYYNLRIFPASSFKARKVALQFHHTFDDDSAAGAVPLMTACVPVAFDSTYVYYYNATNPSFEKALKVMQATFSTEDRSEYSVDIPGLGSGTFSSGKTLILTGNKIFKLQPGSVVSEDPSAGNEFLWTGRDAKSNGMTAGITTNLSDATMRFEDEPDTRIIIMDLRNSVWDWNEYYKKRAEILGYTFTSYAGYEKFNIRERAQKYAILALQQYLREGQKFNVLFGGTTVQSVFDAPVEATAGNIELAVNAIIAATASADALTEKLLEEAIRQAPKGIALLISDLLQPPGYQIRVDNKYVISETGTAYDSSIIRLAAMVKKSDLTLFTIDDNYQLLRIALESGGYRLSGILNRYNIAYSYKIVDGKRICIPELPSLFGSSNYSGIRNLSVTSDMLTAIAYTVDGYYNGYSYYYRGGMEVDMAVMAKSLAKIVLPSTYNISNVLVRIAGKLNIENDGKPVTLTISGKTGGLRFSQNITAGGSYSPTISSYQPFVDPQWAFRSSEQLGFSDYIANASAVKAIGKEYHIVTRQTSLLALEPGMNLWVDSAWQQEQQSVVSTSGGVASEKMDASASSLEAGGAPTSAVGSGVALDGVSLADILAGDIAAVAATKTVKRAISVKAIGTTIRIAFPSVQFTSPIVLHLYDLNGRLIAKKCVMPGEFNGASLQWDIARSAQGLSKGMYTVRISAGLIKDVFRITLMGS